MNPYALIDLHLHLDGSLSLASVRELAALSGVALDEDDRALLSRLQVGPDCRDLNEYLTIFGSNKRKLQQLRRKIEKWLNEHFLELKKDWQIFPLSGRMPDAVGYRYGRDYTLPRKHTFFRTKQAISRYRRRKRRGSRIPVKMALSIVSRLGMLEHCNNAHIYRILFDGEKIEKDLKDIIRESQKEVMKWSTFLEQYKEAVRNLNASKRSGTNTQPCMAGS